MGRDNSVKLCEKGGHGLVLNIKGTKVCVILITLRDEEEMPQNEVSLKSIQQPLPWQAEPGQRRQQGHIFHLMRKELVCPRHWLEGPKPLESCT